MKRSVSIHQWLLIGLLVPVFANADPIAGDPRQGAQRWAETCIRCHNLRDPAEFEAKLWKASITHMRIRAGLTGKDAADILAFMISGSPDANQTFNVIPAASGAMPASAPGTGAQATDGASLYRASTCIACHGENGTGVIPGVPNLSAEDSPLVRKSESELAQNIANGFQSPGSSLAMPPKGGDPSLTMAEIHALLEHMIQAFGKP